MTIKQPPNNIPAEQELLGQIINSEKNLLDVIDIVDEDCFYNTKHKIIFCAIKELFESGKQITINSLVHMLGSSIQQITITYIASLATSAFTDTTAITNANILKDLGYRRKIIKETYTLLDVAHNTNANILKGLGEFENNTILQEDKKNIWTMEDVMYSTVETVEQNYKNGGKVVGMETGLTSLDRALNGFRKGDLFIIAARPSMGKTVFALNLAERLSRKHSVYFASLEMLKEKLGMRLLAAKTHINSLKIGTGNIGTKDWDKVALDSSMLSRNKLFIDDSSELSMLDIKNRCKKIKNKNGLDIIFIDHIGLLKAHTKRESRNLEIGDISRMGKIIAKELNCTVIFLSQLSRAPEQRTDHRPILSDLRESGNIEQDADSIMFLYRDEYYNDQTQDKGIIEAIIRKNRDGQIGTLKFAYLEQYQLIGELNTVYN
ncbi:replicative DNA helicase [Clostridium rectalis]|uniref:replicative DNA helicase n=1 Tax=Clostridium rectalis TaxID=2040295 RepID=UPI000F644044|nr:replicative DNA helicase [Clostridium rectalis]